MFNRKKKIIILFLLLFSFFSTIGVNQASAINFTPQVTIPGSNFEAGTSTKIKKDATTIGEYIRSVYDYLIAIIGLLAVIVLMLAGVIWLTAGGNAERIGQAKGLITGSLTGVVLVLVSYVILETINPELVNFGNTKIEEVKKYPSDRIGCFWQASCGSDQYQSEGTLCGKLPEMLSPDNTCCCSEGYGEYNITVSVPTGQTICNYDNKIDLDNYEECDGSDFGGWTCEDLTDTNNNNPFSGGTLQCQDCKMLFNNCY